MPLPYKAPPVFDRRFLLELAGGQIYSQAERLFETGAVESVYWRSPVLVGQVKGLRDLYRPNLNLRSTVFTENRCNCEDGRKGKVCAHAVAAALHFEALKQEAVAAANPHPDAEPVAEAEPSEAPVPRLRSIQVASGGDSFRLLVFLPPNFEAGAERDAITLKLEAALGREICPLAKLNSKGVYQVSDAQVAALLLIESWCGGRLAGLIQLTRVRLRRLLQALVGEPVVYWLKNPSAPIEWRACELVGVHAFLGSEAIEPEAVEPPSEPLVRDSLGRGARDRTLVAGSEKHFQPKLSLREKTRPNLRRMAEAKAQERWKSGAGDFPAAEGASDSMEAYSDQRVIVDGSLNFIAIRLPQGERAEAVAGLRTLLKTEGFLLEPSNRKWWLRDRHKTLNFMAAHWKTLGEKWRAVFTENFKEKLAKLSFTELKVTTEETEGSFSLKIDISDAGDEAELRRAIASGKNYLDEGEGPIRLIDARVLEQLHQIERAVSGQADRPFTPTFSKRLETQDLVDVEDLLEEMVEGWQPPQAWQSRSRALKQVGALEPAPVRPGFDSILRTYQRIGTAWLWHLYRHQLGGILADEMGLGKTLQALALIECIRTSGAASTPALVVCPASLVENWAREAGRFVPGLSVVRHHGTKRAREPVQLLDHAIVITSYGTLRQDADLLATMEWSVIIGDEAQHIKNRRTQNARSLSRLQSKGRFLLTGTPVENSLEDLLSLFAFLMPGYLAKAPRQSSQEDKAWHSSRQTVRAAAYILRRTKQEVAPELPEKIEKTFFCELGARQAKFYQNTLEKTRRDIFNLEMAGAHAGRVRFAAFTELLRLRQACVDPRIIDPEFPEKESSKLAAFDEILDECLDAGSRILVFSSFVSALKLLAGHLENKGHRFSYLDGQTRKRQAVCDEFNSDAEIPVFLISLKAGGTGLNLTGADTVVHYDPWWNPAAEAQATDRAHRIGQDKVVTSIKLIAADTVEEKVLELQARKAEILKELFEESEAANAKVSLEDIKELLGTIPGIPPQLV